MPKNQRFPRESARFFIIPPVLISITCITHARRKRHQPRPQLTSKRTTGRSVRVSPLKNSRRIPRSSHQGRGRQPSRNGLPPSAGDTKHPRKVHAFTADGSAAPRLHSSKLVDSSVL